MAEGDQHMDVAEINIPPLVPNGEQVAPNDPAFVKACLASLDYIQGLGAIHAGPPRLTVNPSWGPVVRADFTINGNDHPGLVNRIVCWRQHSGVLATNYAFGQDVPPLVTKP
jgi:hypothetical protein